MIVNFDRKKLEDLLLKLQTKYLDKSLVFELSYLTNPNGSFSSIDNVSDDDLKTICDTLNFLHEENSRNN